MKRVYFPGSILLLLFLNSLNSFSQTGYPLQPVSGADGVFEVLDMEGETVYRSKATSDGYNFYMYSKTSEVIHQLTVYVEVTYLDIGYGEIGIQYNNNTQDYRMVETSYNNFVLGSGQKRTAVYELPGADFRNAQNLETDLRLFCDPSLQMHILSATLFIDPTPLFATYAEDFLLPYEGLVYTGDHLINSDSLTGKVMCGYQGWFRASGDPAGHGRNHYANGDFTDLTVDMWPDMSEYSQEEKYTVPGWTYEDGSQATLFSSANKRTVLRHFQWMETYDIDGVAIQRFISGGNLQIRNRSFRIPSYAREAANRTGRTYYIMYDMSGCDTTLLVDVLTADWKTFVDSMKITEDERYLHHEGKPVVGIFGFFRNRFSATLGNKVLDIFQNEGEYQAFVAGSGQWWVQEESSPDWKEVFKRMDAWIPWNVGNYNGDYANTLYWDQDHTFFTDAGVIYMPLIYPGFSWDNLMNQPPGTTYKSRLKGDFMWQQFLDAKELAAQSIYVAMYDEIDEGTAIFKVTNDIPVNHYFIDLEGLNSDFYLLLTGEGTRMMRDEVPIPAEMPDFTLRSQPPIPDIIDPNNGDSVLIPFTVTWSSVQHESGITGYELEANGQLIDKTSTSQEFVLDDGVYSFRVRAINGLNNKGGWSLPLIVHVNNALSDKTVMNQEPDQVVFSQNYPNPFTTHTMIRFTLQKREPVTLDIFNMNGQKLAALIDGELDVGVHEVIYASNGLPGGIYFYKVTTSKINETRRMIILN